MQRKKRKKKQKEQGEVEEGWRRGRKWGRVGGWVGGGGGVGVVMAGQSDLWLFLKGKRQIRLAEEGDSTFVTDGIDDRPYGDG